MGEALTCYSEFQKLVWPPTNQMLPRIPGPSVPLNPKDFFIRTSFVGKWYVSIIMAKQRRCTVSNGIEAAFVALGTISVNGFVCTLD